MLLILLRKVISPGGEMGSRGDRAEMGYLRAEVMRWEDCTCEQ